MFLTFEGVDSSGKSTQAAIVVEALRAHGGAAVHFIREPGGTAFSERLRGILLDRDNMGLSDTAEVFLFSASRAQLVREVIQPALRRGEYVVCDRFHDSTTAYQGYGRGIDLDAIRVINDMAKAGTDPDVTILVDITVEEMERRKRAAGSGLDRMELAGQAFYERVREGYHTIARENAHRFVIVDGMRSVRAIAEEIRHEIEERLERIQSKER
jgi:dTMP kinase